MFLLFVLACVPAFAQQKGGKTARADTFKLAGRFVAKKKFRKAAKLYTAYHRRHPKDVNATWKLAQTQLWLNNFRKSDTLYHTALTLDPANDYLRLNYIHSLLDMGRTTQANNMLTDMELAGKDYSDMSMLRAKLSFYNGDYKLAAAYMKKSLNAENNNAEGHDLDDQIALARAPFISLNTAYLTDNQPYTAIISSVRLENYFSKYADLYIVCDEYHFTQDKISDAPWVRVGDKLFFPKAGIHMNIGAGVFKYPVMNEIGWSANLSVNKKISPHFDIELSGEHTPYLDTKASVDSDISATKVSATLNWHLRNWSAQVSVFNSTYPNNGNVYGTYGWALAPIVNTAHVQILAGASISYSNSDSNSYRSDRTLSDILANYALNPTVTGIYTYFTPNQLFTTSGLLQLNIYPSKTISINLSGDIGYGSIDAPYLFLNKGITGNTFIDKGYATQTFTPANARAALNFHIAKTWLLSLKYAYTHTYFFESNYAGIGLQKSFLPHKRKAGDGTGSTFSRLVDEIEAEIQGLYKSRDEEDLKNSVSEIRSKLVTLRDAQKARETNTENVKGSDENNTLLDRYDYLNEMIEQLDAVDLSDYDASAKSKKAWLVDKLFELTSITYNGGRD